MSKIVLGDQVNFKSDSIVHQISQLGIESKTVRTEKYDPSLVAAESKRLHKLFQDLDHDQDGSISVEDITTGLHKMGYYHIEYHDIEEYLAKSDSNQDGVLDLNEFTAYLIEHEKHLHFVFSSLDKDQDGRLSVSELIVAFHEMGIDLQEVEAQILLKRIREDDMTLDMDYKEWREMLQFAPSSDPEDIINYWRQAAMYYVDYMDFGDIAVNVPEDPSWLEGMWWRHLAAGGVAGAISRTCTAPLDRLKVFLQVHGGRKSEGLVHTFRYMLSEGGLKGLWRGNFVNVIKIAPESAIKFGVYDQVKRLIRGNAERDLQIHERFVAGSFAGAVSQSVIYPLEVMKTRLALRKTGQFTGIGDCAIKLFQAEGIKVFYRGYVPNLLGIIPYAGIDLAIYETLKQRYIETRCRTESPSPFMPLCCGMVSSCCGQLATYPLALIRTKLQSLAGLPHLVQELHPDQKHTLGLFRYTIRTEGYKGLYRGIVPNFCKVAPAVSISYYVYETAISFLGAEMN